MSDDFLIGCPVYRRAWILPAWFDHVRAACEKANITPAYAFVVDPADEETMEAISVQEGGGYVFGVPDKRNQERRAWNKERYEWMVELRNELLGVVRLVEPRLFLSLDSDILLHPDAIANMLETIQECDAVGGRAYMTPTGVNFPSYANLGREGSLIRKDFDGVFPIEVIMAIKLMKPQAYSVDYRYDRQGEDIGWSKACREAGLKLMVDARVGNKHVMAPEFMGFDKRVGY